MAVRRLRVESFRNFNLAELVLSPELNCLVGANGSGKTSLLEAIFLVARGRSFRSASLDVLATHPLKHFKALLELEYGASSDTVLFAKTAGHSPEIRLNSTLVARLSEVASRIPVQLLTPEIADLVLSGPVERRQYLDWGLFHVEQGYHRVARDYARALKQRNLLLRNHPRSLSEAEDVWAKVLVELGDKITDFREAYCLELFPLVDRVVSELELGLTLEFRYQRGWPDNTLLEQSMHDGRLADFRSGTTRIGPHRADIKMKTDGHPSAQVLSRGQAKLLAVALHIAQVQLLAKRAGKRCTVLFDEMIAELDHRHVSLVLTMLRRLESQVILTSVELPEALKGLIGKNSRVFHVKQGVIDAL